VPHNPAGASDAELQINSELESSALERLTTFLKSDNSLYLVPVNLTPGVTSNPQALSGYCDDNRLDAIAVPVVQWNLTGGPRYNAYGRLIGYDGEANVGMSFYVLDCYGAPFFVEQKSKSENRHFAHRTPDREVVDMANDLLDHLMQVFADARTTHQAAWNSLLKTGLAIDPADPGLHPLFTFVKKPEGYQVTVVVPDGPADHAGVKTSDIIERVNDVDANTLTTADLMTMLKTPSYTLVLQRPGGPVTVTVHPQTYPQLVKALQH
jgi:hypothetical protein